MSHSCTQKRNGRVYIKKMSVGAPLPSNDPSTLLRAPKNKKITLGKTNDMWQVKDTTINNYESIHEK